MSLLWVHAAAKDNPVEIHPDGFLPIDTEAHQHLTVPIEHVQDGDLVRPDWAKILPFERAFRSLHDPAHPGNNPDEGHRMWVIEHHRRFSPHMPEGTPYEVYRPRADS